MKVLIIIALLLSIEPSYCRNWHRISRKVMKEQMKIRKYDNEKFFLRQCAQCRKEIDVLNRLNVHKKDTLFIYEILDAKSPSPVKSIMWTHRERLCYKRKSPKAPIVFCSYEEFSGKDLYLLPDFNFQYQMELAEKWDIETLQKESRENRYIECFVVYLTRIIFGKNSYKIDVTWFVDFCNFEREKKAIDDYIKNYKPRGARCSKK